MGKKIKVGLYGVEGHQIHNELNNHPKAEAVALCGFPSNQIPSHLKEVRVVENLGEMLADSKTSRGNRSFRHWKRESTSMPKSHAACPRSCLTGFWMLPVAQNGVSMK